MIHQNEQSILGSCLIDQEALDRALGDLKASDFSSESHRVLFDTIRTMADAGIIPDLITVTTELTKAGSLDKVGGSFYIAELYEQYASPATIGYCCNQIKDAAKKRRLANVGKAIERNLDTMPADKLQAKIEDALYAVDDTTQGLVHIKSVCRSSFKMIEKSWQNKGAISGLKTGIYDLDTLLNGLNAPDLTIIAGRPGMGKSAFMGNVVENVGLVEKRPVAIFSHEMSSEQLVNRMIFGRSKVDGSRARIGNFHDGDWPRMTQSAGELAAAEIYLDDSSGLHVSDLRARARRLKRKQGLSLVCIDYLQLLRGDGDSRTQEIGFISRSLKGMAKELDVPVIALCQLSRKVEERSNKRPMCSDLRDSGEIEQDADNIIFLYRDAVYNENADEREAEAIVAKQRNGPTGIVYVNWRGEFSRFENKDMKYV